MNLLAPVSERVTADGPRARQRRPSGAYHSLGAIRLPDD